MLVTLPHGILEGQDLFDTVEIDELRGKQQNYLTDKDLVVGNIGHIPRILEDMILSLQTKEGVKWRGKIADAVFRLTAGDIETLIVKIRENTYGPRFYHEAECPHCGAKSKNLRLDLDKLEMKKLTLADLVAPKTVELPSDGTKIELKPIYMKDLFEVVKITHSKQKKLVTALLAVSINKLGDKSPITDEDVDNLRAKDLQYLGDQLNEMKLDGEIDTQIDINCDKCKTDFSIKLNTFEPSFFAPTKGSSTSST